MIALLIILIVSIAYAVIRAFHDSKISNGKWKTWAFIEGALICLVVSILTAMLFFMRWWMTIPLAMIFAFVFWLVFDCMEGYLRTGNILHLGEYGFDLKMRKTFYYDKPILGWRNTGAIRLVLFKCFWIGLWIPAYFSLSNL